MTRYRLSGTVEEAHLPSVIAAFGAAGLKSELDPEITLALMSKFNAVVRDRAISTSDAPAVPQTPARAKPTTKRTVRRMSKGNGEWPAPGSIYDVVLRAIQDEPKSPQDLRGVLAANGFSTGSLNSALGRLEKNGKARNGEGGWLAAA